MIVQHSRISAAVQRQRLTAILPAHRRLFVTSLSMAIANMGTSVFFWMIQFLQCVPLFLFQTILVIYAWKNRKDRISINVESPSKAMSIRDVIDSKHELLPQAHVGI